MKPFFLNLLFFLFNTFAIQSAFINPTFNPPVKAYSLNQNYSTEYFLSIYFPSLILVNAYIEVEFPFSFQIPSSCALTILNPKGILSQPNCEKIHAQKYLIPIGKLIPGNYTLIFENIHNPVLSETSNFKIKTFKNRHTPIDSNEALGSVKLISSPCK